MARTEIFESQETDAPSNKQNNIEYRYVECQDSVGNQDGQPNNCGDTT